MLIGGGGVGEDRRVTKRISVARKRVPPANRIMKRLLFFDEAWIGIEGIRSWCFSGEFLSSFLSALLRASLIRLIMQYGFL